LRLKASQRVLFHDRAQGPQDQDVAAAIGDFVLYRADGQFAYQLAVIVDDAEQSVTDIVRGADLLDSTARQIHLQRLLGHRQPRYLHVPIAVNAAGAKLSKQSGAPPIEVSKKEELLRQALVFLGQAPTENLADAIRNWDPSRIPAASTRYFA
jgi:glutamyl-Q tRNA(Asp) synthetase